MVHININPNEVPLELPMPPVGVPVDFEITDVQEKTTSTGKPMLAVSFQVKNCEAEGEFVYDNFVDYDTNKRTRVRLRRLAECVGLDISNGFDSEALIGRQGKFVLSADEYNGREMRRVSDYLVG